MSGSAAAPAWLIVAFVPHNIHRTHSIQDTLTQDTLTQDTALTGERQGAFHRWAFNCNTCNEILSKCKANQCASVLFANSIAAGRFGVFGYCLLLLCSCLSIYCQATFYVSSFVVLTLLKSPNPGPHCHQPTCHTVTCFQSGRNVGVICIISCQIVLDCCHIQYMSAGEQVFCSTFIT